MKNEKSTPYTSIVKITTNAVGFTFKNSLSFLKYWTLPFLASVLFYMLTIGVMTKLPSNLFTNMLQNISYILTGVVGLLTASYWVPKWIQYYETGKSSPLLEYTAVNKIYFRKSLIFSALAIASLLVVMVLTTILGHLSQTLGMLGIIILIPGFFYLCYRFCFIIPAAALGDTLTLADSWEKTKKGTWQFLGLILLLTLLVNLPFILIGLLTTLIGHIQGGGIMATVILLGSIVLFVANILFFGAFSIAWTNFYKRIR